MYFTNSRIENRNFLVHAAECLFQYVGTADTCSYIRVVVYEGIE